jgi:HlyD family secretion protein
LDSGEIKTTVPNLHMTCSRFLLVEIFSCLTRAVLLGVIGFSTACSEPSPAPPSVTTQAVSANNVVALGRLVPKGEVIKLSVPNAQDSRVNQILVKEGEWVEAGEVIAVLQGSDRKQRDLEEAIKNVEYYRAKLEQIQSGDAKQAEIAAQQANIARLKAQLEHETAERKAAIASAEAELRQAELNYKRNEPLAQHGVITQEKVDLTKKEWETTKAIKAQREAQLNNTLQTLEKQIAQEQRNLERLQEVRPVDVRVAQTELERALVSVEQRKADLEDTKVKVPVAGKILRINTRVGEQVNTQQGIVELGQTDQMYAIAEVYETEINQVRQGQQATITSEYGGFKEEVKGSVEYIGLQIGARTIAGGSSNPTTDENTRVVEVKIRIDPKDNSKVADLTNMQVRVTIDTKPTSPSGSKP